MQLGIAWEVLRRVAVKEVSRGLGWIIGGLAGPMAILLYTLLKPFSVRQAYPDFQNAVLLTCAWFFLYAIVHSITIWLKPDEQVEQSGLAVTLIPPVQFYLHRAIRLCAVPLAVLLLCLPLYAVLLIYTGDPYNSGSGHMVYSTRADWEWAESTNPWGLRVLFVGMNLASSMLLPLAVAVAMHEIIPRNFVRITMLPVFFALLYYIDHVIEYDYLRMCYRQTVGHNPWAYLGIAIALFLLPVLLGILNTRGRSVVAVLLTLIVITFCFLPFSSDVIERDAGFKRLARHTLGDGRYSLAYFAGHLALHTNIDMLLNSYQSCVLTTDVHLGNFIPQRVSIWVGAGIYPLAFGIWLPIGLALGIVIRRRQAVD